MYLVDGHRTILYGSKMTMAMSSLQNGDFNFQVLYITGREFSIHN